MSFLCSLPPNYWIILKPVLDIIFFSSIRTSLGTSNFNITITPSLHAKNNNSLVLCTIQSMLKSSCLYHIHFLFRWFSFFKSGLKVHTLPLIAVSFNVQVHLPLPPFSCHLLVGETRLFCNIAIVDFVDCFLWYHLRDHSVLWYFCKWSGVPSSSPQEYRWEVVLPSTAHQEA